MIKHFLFLLFLSINVFVLGHGTHKAYFTLQKSDSGIDLLIRLDEEDISRELSLSEIDYENKTIGIIKYIKERLLININSEGVDYEFIDSFSGKGYLNLRFDMKLPENEIEAIKVFNRCFENHSHGYDNILRINVHGQDVTYKLNSERKEIVHNF